MLKKLISLGLVVVLFSLSLSLSYADDFNIDGSDDTKYDNAISASSVISISNGVATLKSKLTGKTGVTTIKCTMTLQKKNGTSWNKVQSWTKEVNASSISFQKAHNVSHGTYRSKAVFKVYKNSSYETITKYSSSVAY